MPPPPELLVRAALVCKRWFRLISDPHFRRRFRELHRAAPMLGFFCTDHLASRFVPTSSAPLPHAIPGDWRAVDARHGRVLLNTAACWDDFTFFGSGEDLVVWDPVTGEQHQAVGAHVPTPVPVLLPLDRGGAMCPGGGRLRSSLSTRRRLVHGAVQPLLSSAVPASIWQSLVPLWGRQEISLIHLPKKPYRHIALMTMADGGLGFAAVHGLKLDLWSMVSGTKGYAKWAQSQAIDLETIGTLSVSFETVCCIDGVAPILMGNDKTYVIINLKSGQIRKIAEGRITYPVVPYTSFYTPALGAATTCEGPREGSSSA
ncbi:unnamed protein product [Urochloa decumbens]|uniref:F-box domain-containing protein n=1 Tax=Urochloa decumbens TaxID=240449 RepID=A0ABC8WRK9_9POAL